MTLVFTLLIGIAALTLIVYHAAELAALAASVREVMRHREIPSGAGA